MKFYQRKKKNSDMKRRRTTTPPPPPPPQQNAAMNPNYLDRFSDLPEPIIHHIMSLVPSKYAARTSALSKRFRSAWLSFPVIDFDATLYPGSYRDTTGQFITFVRNSLNRRDPNACLEKLRIKGLFDGSTFNNWLINYALDKHVKEIYLFDDSNVDTCLPQRMFCANSIRVLELKGFKVEVPDLILSCPLIEDFGVTRCSGLKSIRVSGAKKLKAVKLDTCSGLEKIDIDAQNLESFSYTGCRDVDPSQPPQPCEILMTTCKSLKSLSLEFASIMDLWLYDHVSKFPILKILKLYECRGLKYISLFHTNIEEIELKNCDGLEMVGIVAQNLQSFVYRMNRRKQCDINISAGKFLRNLILHGATITDRWIEDNMSAFCLLERLGLECCNVLQKIKFHNANIKEIELKNCDGLEMVDIVAQNLQSFVYSMDRSKQCDINISACKCLGNLILRGATITDRWIQDNISAFCLLERLRLECCKVLQKIKFHNALLTCFELHDCDVEEAEIDAPNLNSFEYTGQIMAPPVIISSHWDAMIKLKETDLPPYLWFKKLREFLLGFDTCKVLTLICNNDKELIIPKELREQMLPPLFDIKHVKIQLRCRTDLMGLLQSLVWLIPRPETISFVKGSNEESIKFQYFMSVDMEEDSCCCRYRLIKCCTHRLRSIALHNFGDVADRDNVMKFFIRNSKRLEMIYDNSDAFKIVKGHLISSQIIDE